MNKYLWPKKSSSSSHNTDIPFLSPDCGEGECDAGLYADDYEMTGGLLEIGWRPPPSQSEELRGIEVVRVFYFSTTSKGASLVAQTLKNLPTMQEAWIQSLGQEDPLEKGMATHSNILAWRIPWTEEPGRLYSPWGSKVSDTTEWLAIHFKLIYSVSNKILKEIK